MSNGSLRRLTARVFLPLVCAGVGAVVASVTSSAATPDFQPTSVAFLDREHGVLAREDWSCRKERGCAAQILVSSDGGNTWRVTHRTTMPVRLYSIRGTRQVWASTGKDVLESRDGGLSWRRGLPYPAAAIAFADSSHGWLLPAGSMFDRPKPLLETGSGGANWRRIGDPCRRQWALTVALSRPTPREGWIACVSQASTGFQGKEVWSTGDGGKTWQLRARTKFPGLPGAARFPEKGNLPGFGYVTGIDFLPNGHGWLWEGRGWLLTTHDAGTSWRRSSITKADVLAAQSASLVSDRLGYVLLRGCNARLVRTTDGGVRWKTVERWGSPTRC